MMTFIIFGALLVALIIVHEFGHFIVAKAFKIRVEEFAIFFPPRLLRWHWGETQLSLGAVPLGGFVKIAGEDSAAPSDAGEDRGNFSNRSFLVRAAVIAAGVVFNVVFAWLLLSVGYLHGMQTSVDHTGVGQVAGSQVTIVGVLPGSPAEKAGIEPDDIVTSIDTGSASLPHDATADKVQQFIVDHQNESMVIGVERGGQELHLLAKPVDGLVAGHKALGINLDDVGILKLSLPLALVQGAVLLWSMTSASVAGFGSLLAGLFHGSGTLNNVAGPIGIVHIGATAVAHGFVETILVVALISLNLAIINVLPIPGLDGGRLLFMIIEKILRRPISEELSSRITVASFALIGLFALIVSYHDVITWLHPV